MRAVLDTNVIISALLRNPSVPRQIVDAALEGRFELVNSEPLRIELLRVLNRPRVSRRIPERDSLISGFVARLWHRSTMVEPRRRVNIVHRDPADNRVIEAALAGRCEYIISGDADLLQLGVVEGARIVTPAEFLKVLDDEAGA